MIGQALTLAAPLYNLGFVAVACILFVLLFKKGKDEMFLFPWKLIFGGMCIFIFETIFTILRSLHIINLPVHVNGFFELAIVVLFIYAILLQRDFILKRS